MSNWRKSNIVDYLCHIDFAIAIHILSPDECTLGRTLMPLFTVTMKAGRAAGEKNAISRAIHEASIKAGYAADDMFQRFLCVL